MKHLAVKLWGEELGRLVWNSSSNSSYFTFNPEATDRPDVAPLAYPKSRWKKEIPAFGDSRRIYQGLPPFIADSLPDSWGNKLFEQWVKQSGLPKNKINPLLKLMFIGSRGMGALEYEPAAQDLEHRSFVEIGELYTLSLNVLKDKAEILLHASNELTMQSLLAVGTSAGGRQMKAVVAYNPDTNEMRSGQTEAPAGFDYYIVKFEDDVVPTTEIEMAYYEMALKCRIDMELCRTIDINGISHFMTRRFDRKDGQKIHMQTLAAINPEADSYEDLMATCKALGLTEREIVEVYRRLIFNVMLNNTDDHNKNFSFLLGKNGKWELSPAYDLTFIFNRYGTGPETSHVFSLNGKTSGITKEDLLAFGKENCIRDADGIIAQVVNAISLFPALADKYRIQDPWKHIIWKTLRQNLIKFGGVEFPAHLSDFTDSLGREFKNVAIRTNSRGYYQISAVIDELPHKRIIRPNNAFYSELKRYELGDIDSQQFVNLLERLFTENE